MSSRPRNSSFSENPSIRRFGDCALVEIIHLHDCLRGAIADLQKDVTDLSKEFPSSSKSTSPSSTSMLLCTSKNSNKRKRVEDLERRIASRFQLIWSVFKAHSKAEDEFIWPALREKIDAKRKNTSTSDQMQVDVIPSNPEEVIQSDHSSNLPSNDATSYASSSSQSRIIEQEEYEEDHADEERMFIQMDSLLAKLRDGLYSRKRNCVTNKSTSSQISKSNINVNTPNGDGSQARSLTIQNTNNELTQSKNQQTPLEEVQVQQISQSLKDQITILSEHLLEHLEKEENHCMPLVKQHLTQDEIKDLVGRIMGKRSNEIMIQILNLAVNNLPEEDRVKMVTYMKQAMVGTFFERWLMMGGWIGSSGGLQKQQDQRQNKDNIENEEETIDLQKILCRVSSSTSLYKTSSTSSNFNLNTNTMTTKEVPESVQAGEMTQTKTIQKRKDTQEDENCTSSDQVAQGIGKDNNSQTSLALTTTKEELEKLIRAIASNPELTPKQKNTTIQGLRDSVYKSRKKRRLDDNISNGKDGSKCGGERMTSNSDNDNRTGPLHSSADVNRNNFETMQSEATTLALRKAPPSACYRKNIHGNLELVWNNNSSPSRLSTDRSVPLFTAAELAPTYHDGANGSILGCPHYSRACKLRHPSSGRLYTCRLCCEQDREMPMKNKDSPLDRYAVTEILCMRCNTLQPSGLEYCTNLKCQPKKPFARYHCKICNFYDDSPNKSIYHCPFCNVCRSGKGLGIDYRHCMRCNACVSLTEDNHVCIPQRLQGNCPICHETMFESTEPLRGLKCGHVMHLSCYNMYMRGQAYTCPLCKKSVEDMREYFALLDSAVRMQPMPAAYAATHSSIYCQDCGKVGKVQYHFVGCKCAHCGSYNTREIRRSEDETTQDT